MVKTTFSRRQLLAGAAGAGLTGAVVRPRRLLAQGAGNAAGQGRAGSLVELTDRIRGGAVSARDIVDGLDRDLFAIASLNATRSIDLPAIRQAARQADQAVQDGGEPGPLAGVPISVKDNFLVAGHPGAAATPALAGLTPSDDAPAVARLRGAGAAIGIKDNMHELALGITSRNAAYGAVRNPYDPTRLPGGSSGGSAAAVASGVVPAALGSDTGGSARIPAALCGIAGFRPTHGRYPTGGVVPISNQRDTPGVLARESRDIAFLDAILAGEDTASDDGPTDLAGLRLGVPRSYFYAPLSPGVDAAVSGALDRLANAGAELIEVPLPDVGELNRQAAFPMVLYDLVRDLPAFLDQHAQGLSFDALVAGVASPDVRRAFAQARGDQAVPEEGYSAAMAAAQRLRETYEAYFRENDLAAMVVPTTPLAAAPLAEHTQVSFAGGTEPTFPTYIRNTDPVTVAGLPSLTVPAGTTAEGLPVGISFDGPAGSDRKVLAIAQAFEGLGDGLPRPAFWRGG